MFRIFGNTLKDEISGQCWTFSDHRPTEKDVRPIVLKLFADACGRWIDWLMRQPDPMNVNDIGYVDSIRWAFQTYQKKISIVDWRQSDNDKYKEACDTMMIYYRHLTGASDEMQQYARMLYDYNAPLITKSAPAPQLSLF